MSLFLGKIHYWLYNKILWAEKTEREIISFANENKLPIEQWVLQGLEKYGPPTESQALEDIIDTSNIHGWLQERIKSAELRQAALITNILDENKGYKDGLIDVFKSQGQAATLEYTEQPNTPQGLFNAVNDYVLEGMPCDRASEVLSNDKDEIIWKTATAIHEPYWLEVKGNIQNFSDLREAWVSAFIKGLNPEFQYNKDEDGNHSITRR